MATGLLNRTADRTSLRLAALIRCGQLCKDCRGGECRDSGQKRIECVECHGKGCDNCDSGHTVVDGCNQIGAAPMVESVRMFELADKGHLPITGGLLDQSAWFVEAYRFYAADVDKIKAEL